MKNQYAGFWRRWCASIVDSWIIFFIGLGISAALGTDPFPVDAAGTMENLDRVLSFVFAVGFYVLFWVNFDGATPGKKMFGIKLVSTSGSKITYPQAIIRYFAQWLSAFVFLLGYAWVIWDKKKQAWHDKIAQTVVIKTNSKNYLGLGVFVFILGTAAIIGMSVYYYLKTTHNQDGATALRNISEARKIKDSQQESLNSMTPEVKTLYDESQENFRRLREEKLSEKEIIALSNKNIDTLIKATELAPNNDILWLNLSNAYTWNNSKGGYEESLAAIDKAIAIRPENFTYVTNEAELLITLKRNDEAVLLMEDLGRRIDTSNYAYYHQTLGKAYMNLRINDKALEHLQKAVEIFSGENEDGNYDQQILSTQKMMAEIQN